MQNCPDNPQQQTACPAGTFRALPGAKNVTDCEACAPGTYCPDAGATTNATCPEGSYCPTSLEKVECPEGRECPAGSTCPPAPRSRSRSAPPPATRRRPGALFFTFLVCIRNKTRFRLCVDVYM